MTPYHPNCRCTTQIHPLNILHESMRGCNDIACGLHTSKSGAMQVVPGKGNPQAKIVIIGEAPGADEDRVGTPFVGDSGKLLDNILSEVGIPRDDIYITNICKCRPPSNRTPFLLEMESCSKWLSSELTIIRPDVIVTLGNIPKDRLIPSMPGIRACHGTVLARWMRDDSIKSSPYGGGVIGPEDTSIDMRKVTYLFTYHPSYIKRMGGVGGQIYNETVMDMEKLIDICYDNEKGWRR